MGRVRRRGARYRRRPATTCCTSSGPGLAFLATVRSRRRTEDASRVSGRGRRRLVCVRRQPDTEARRPRTATAGTRSHTFPPKDVDDEFYVTGVARPAEDDVARRQHVLDVYLAQGTTTENDTLFELLLDHVMHAAYQPRPSWPPIYTKWKAA